MARARLSVLEPLKERDQLAQRTYEAIRAAILANAIPPGTPLSVPELARRLEVSRSPVREAVQRLIYDGLASHVPNRGAVVDQVEVDEITELYAVREVLEGLAARLATQNASRDGVDSLREITAQHEELVRDGGDVDAHLQLDMAFHRTIRTLAGNHYLSEILESIVNRSHSVMHSLWPISEAAHAALCEHQTILDAMAAGAPEVAEEAAREHISRLRVRLLQTLRAAPSPVAAAT
ncbi:GntR family transcriptional regulator [Georgenia satyanarayanai]|uniref:GntR family transcriptional regulator n=1 Tax=Georgenia satyanarayanai TaxID=860221 RepID=UPI00203A5FB3|nr:GntR family transcriptional regulator [Georgenia satyanarayanai]MCM3660619.1 GntR family transcriptional regulator [Georgenia satyanarayanai]